MAIYLRREEEIEKIRASCRIVAECFGIMSSAVKPGVTTAELERQIVEHIESRGAASAFKGYRGYPASTRPEKTRTHVKCPTCGSVTILNAEAQKGVEKLSGRSNISS